MHPKLLSFAQASHVRPSLPTLLLLLSLVSGFGAGVPVRLSFKFILNASENRPAVGDLNTDAEINARVADGSTMFSQAISELRRENIEIVDVAGISQWYTAEPTAANRDGIRAAAIAAPNTYHWRNDAVNVYISGAPGTPAGGIADLPPNNNIILLPQYSWDNVVAHEAGHILNLLHTHETCCFNNLDACDDTLADNTAWSQDDIAVNNFSGLHYNQLNAAQQDQVNLVWFNVMSYHNGNTALRLSPCQMNRQSAEAYADRNWILSKIPVYLDAGYGGPQDGSFAQPYQTIQQAINANVLNGRVMVLEQGIYPRPAGALTTPMDVVTRWAASTMQCRPAPFSLPSALEESTNKAVRDAVVLAQQSARQHNTAEVIAHLQMAEQHATGREKIALQFELAQRNRDYKRFDEAANWFTKAAEGTDQEALRTRAIERVAAVKILAEKQRTLEQRIPTPAQK